MKHIRNIIFLIYSLIFISGCNFSSYELSHDEKIVNQITKETARELAKEKNLVLIGTGGQMMYGIKKLTMSFQYYQSVNIETARQLLVDSVEKYLANINSNEDIRASLYEYPFTPKGIEIVIFFLNPNGSKVDPKKIWIAASNQGRVTYYTRSSRDAKLEALYTETYDKVKN